MTVLTSKRYWHREAGMKEFEFRAAVWTCLFIEAENEKEAREQLEVYSPDGWVLNGEPVEVSDVELINVGESDARMEMTPIVKQEYLGLLDSHLPARPRPTERK